MSRSTWGRIVTRRLEETRLSRVLPIGKRVFSESAFSPEKLRQGSSVESKLSLGTIATLLTPLRRQLLLAASMALQVDYLHPIFLLGGPSSCNGAGGLLKLAAQSARGVLLEVLVCPLGVGRSWENQSRGARRLSSRRSVVSVFLMNKSQITGGNSCLAVIIGNTRVCRCVSFLE